MVLVFSGGGVVLVVWSSSVSVGIFPQLIWWTAVVALDLVVAE